MKQLFDETSSECSRLITRKYSTSFSLGILFLNPRLRDSIYAVYGFVRLADEIVDSFHSYDKEKLLQKFRNETYEALYNGISLNPVLNSFQSTVHRYGIRHEWIDTFLDSMEMDLKKVTYNESNYKKYILGSAEVVGLMCLHIFTEGDNMLFDTLKPYAMKLGSAFQKVNFLRDAKADLDGLDRNYFPEVNLQNFTDEDKKKIEADIAGDFEEALQGIRRLPRSSRNGVYLAYYYYLMLFRKIKRLPPQRIMSERIRIPNHEKLFLMLKSNLRHQLNLL